MQNIFCWREFIEAHTFCKKHFLVGFINGKGSEGLKVLIHCANEEFNLKEIIFSEFCT